MEFRKCWWEGERLLLEMVGWPLIAPFYSLQVEGVENLPRTGGVLLVGNHQSKIDWLVLQLLLPRHIHFVIDRSYWNLPFLRPFLKVYGAVPISINGAKGGLTEARALLQQGEVVLIFPEGHLTRTGLLSQMRGGYLKIVKGLEGVVVVPFYLAGLWGSRFSYAPSSLHQLKRRWVAVVVGEPFETPPSPDQLKLTLQNLSARAYRLVGRRFDTGQ